MEQGFVRGQSDNLPQIDSLAMASYFATNNDFISAEIRGIKASRSARESYGDSAIGYVQLKREGHICTIKARITPEHKVRKTPYHVTLICNEKTSVVESVQCHDCAASAGGCKHAIAFLSWMHRRSEEPAPTSVKCYWSKSTLSSVGTSIKFLKIKDISKRSASSEDTDGGFLKAVIEGSKQRSLETQLSSYFYDPSIAAQLTIHRLFHAFKSTGACASDVSLFLRYSSNHMNSDVCNEVYKLTTGQATCPLWHEMRYGRITASKAYQVSHCKSLDGSLVESILGANSLVDTPAMERGRKLEHLVLAELRKQTKIKFQICGLLLKKDLPIFAASPDGLSEDYSLEIKCPLSIKSFKTYFTIDQKPANRYMAQIQMQMHFSNKKKSIFCIAHPDFETSKSLHIIYVDYDENYCTDLFDKCFQFWTNAIYPRISV